MRVGITYDLKDDYLAEGLAEEACAEFDSIETIDGIDGALRTLGYDTDRIGHCRALVSRLAKGDRWDVVFNIAEGMSGMGREAQVPALLEAYAIPYTFSDPLVLCVCLHKGITKKLVRLDGVPTADFAIVEEPAEVDAIDLPFPLFVKAAGEGTGKGISETSLVRDRVSLKRTCTSLLETFHQPVLVERFLPGREYTVGIVGNGPKAQTIGVLEIRFREQVKGIYSYHTKANYQELVSYHLVEGEQGRAAREVALAAWRSLRCRDGGRVDLRCDEHGTPHFLEVNPLAGLHPVHSDLPILARLTGVSYVELIRSIMEATLERTGLGPDAAA